MELVSTTAGLFPLPDEQRERLADLKGHQKSDLIDGSESADVTAAYDAARERNVSVQRDGGLGRVVEGQARWDDMLAHPLCVHENVRTEGIVRYYDNNNFYREPVVAGELTESGDLAADLEKAARLCSDLQAVAPGPYSLADLATDEHYGDEAAFLDAVADFLAGEIAAFPDAVETLFLLEPSLVTSPPNEETHERVRDALTAVADATDADVVAHTFWGALDETLHAHLLDASLSALGYDLVCAHDEAAYLVQEYGTADSVALGLVDGQHDNDHFLLTTVVGSYPKPTWLDRARDLREEGESGAFDDGDWAEATDDACRLITHEHERSGLDVVCDGEMRREEMVEFFAERIDGYEFNGPVKVWGHNYFDKPSVADEVGYDEPWLVGEYEFTADVAGRPVKVPITGPYTLAAWSFNEAYDTEAALAYDLADLVNEEITKLVEAGARYIQIDEPALATTPDDHAIVGECLERIVADVPDDVRLGLHVCYGDYSRIYPEINDFPIDEFDVELANGDFEQIDVFTDPDFEPDLALGVTDAHVADVESVAEIKENIREGLKVVPPEKLTVSPDCGLKLLPRDVAYGKMENMVEAARQIEAELDSGELDAAAIRADARSVGADD